MPSRGYSIWHAGPHTGMPGNTRRPGPKTTRPYLARSGSKPRTCRTTRYYVAALSDANGRPSAVPAVPPRGGRHQTRRSHGRLDARMVGGHLAVVAPADEALDLGDPHRAVHPFKYPLLANSRRRPISRSLVKLGTLEGRYSAPRTAQTNSPTVSIATRAPRPFRSTRSNSASGRSNSSTAPSRSSATAAASGTRPWPSLSQAPERWPAQFTLRRDVSTQPSVWRPRRTCESRSRRRGLRWRGGRPRRRRQLPRLKAWCPPGPPVADPSSDLARNPALHCKRLILHLRRPSGPDPASNAAVRSTWLSSCHSSDRPSELWINRIRCRRTDARKTAPTPSLMKLFKLLEQG
jgi:hypothetical protein